MSEANEGGRDSFLSLTSERQDWRVTCYIARQHRLPDVDISDPPPGYHCYLDSRAAAYTDATKHRVWRRNSPQKPIARRPLPHRIRVTQILGFSCRMRLAHGQVWQVTDAFTRGHFPAERAVFPTPHLGF